LQVSHLTFVGTCITIFFPKKISSKGTSISYLKSAPYSFVFVLPLLLLLPLPKILPKSSSKSPNTSSKISEKPPPKLESLNPAAPFSNAW
jgi:hypothetical protein